MNYAPLSCRADCAVSLNAIFCCNFATRQSFACFVNFSYLSLPLDMDQMYLSSNSMVFILSAVGTKNEKPCYYELIP